MGTRQGARSFAREVRERIREQAKLELASLVASQDPIVQRCLERRMTPDDYEVWLTPEFQEKFLPIRDQYEWLLLQDRRAWVAHCRQQPSEYKLLREHRFLGRVAKRGRPEAAPAQREDTLIAREVARLAAHLAAGSALRRDRKAARGVASDDEAIAEDLGKMGYLKDEVAAILAARSAQGAAQVLVARRTGRRPSSVKTSVFRAKRLVGQGSHRK
jgi:hypothetical protein